MKKLMLLVVLLSVASTAWAGTNLTEVSKKMEIWALATPADKTPTMHNTQILWTAVKIMDDLTEQLAYGNGKSLELLGDLHVQVKTYELQAEVMDKVLSQGNFNILTKRPYNRGIITETAGIVLDKFSEEMMKLKSSSSPVGKRAEFDLTKLYNLIHTIEQLADKGENIEKQQRELETIREQFYLARQISANVIPSWEILAMMDKIKEGNANAALKAERVLEASAILREMYERLAHPGASVQTSCVIISEKNLLPPTISEMMKSIDKKNAYELEKIEKEFTSSTIIK